MNKIFIIISILFFCWFVNEKQELITSHIPQVSKTVSNSGSSGVLAGFATPKPEETVREKNLYTVHYEDQIHPDMTPFDIAVEGHEYGDGHQYVAKNITIYRNEKLIQKIELEENQMTGFPTSTSEDFGLTIEDMNFDGYKDLRIIMYIPASPNISYYMWVWNPKANQFQEDNDLEQIFSPRFDHDKKLIYSATKASGNHYIYTYQYINGKLTCVKYNEMGYVNDEDPKNSYSIEYQLIEGEWMLTKKERE